ncbi:TonB-dependent receptor [Bacteroidales bacterium OttesenSCG-928-C03]|nr:TonB-dependent receptor [Bacteroidales bacterium OttesenSCG-928-C03]
MRKYLSLTMLFLLSAGILFSQTDTTKKATAPPSSEESQTTDINEGQDDDDGAGSNYFIPGLLHSSQDVYLGNTSYTFSIAYFKPRGLDGKYQTIAINNFSMNSLVTGRASYSQWGGLNHVVRYPEAVANMNPAAFNFGNVGGATNYNLRASAYKKQIRATYSMANQTYTNRLMFTAASGILKNGWSFAASLSTRFGDQLTYVDGVSYNAFSYFLAAEKQFNKKHALNLTVFGTPTQRGIQANSTNEVYELLDNNYYNPNWGWYNGQKRNARVRTIYEPVAMLTHYFTPENEKYVLTSTITATFGTNSTTSLNWYDAQDPRPDYYRYLPSYQEDPAMQAAIANLWHTDASYRQINWDYMYNVNQLAKQQGSRAQYMVEDRIYSHIQVGGATNLIMNISDHIKLSAGLDIRGMKQRNYKTINDLLGGSYWLDVDKYSEGDFPDNIDVIYNDLDNKNKELTEGDVFGYDYDLYIYKESLWGMLDFTYKKVDFHAGLSLGSTQFWRDGNMRNGRFSEESYGKSETKSFVNTGVKAGVTYKITGRNYLVLNGQFNSDAPGVLDAFVAPRIRNRYVANLENEKIMAADLSYIMNYPKIKMRLTGYFTSIKDRTKLTSFYHDDYASMVNYSMSGIDQQHIGVELGTEIKLTSYLSLVIAGNFGDYIYTSRPSVVINAENGYDILGDDNMTQSQTVYWKNFHVPGSPQAAATMGLKFNHNYWYVNIDANYFDKIYCDMNPERRTTAARGTLPEDSELYQQIIAQTKYDGQFTLNLSVSKSWRIDKYTLGFNLSVNNILNNKKLVTTTWEQYRFDYKEYNLDKFQNKVYYAFGTTFFAGINFQF